MRMRISEMRALCPKYVAQINERNAQLDTLMSAFDKILSDNKYLVDAGSKALRAKIKSKYMPAIKQMRLLNNNFISWTNKYTSRYDSIVGVNTDIDSAQLPQIQSKLSHARATLREQDQNCHTNAGDRAATVSLINKLEKDIKDIEKLRVFDVAVGEYFEMIAYSAKKLWTDLDKQGAFSGFDPVVKHAPSTKAKAAPHTGGGGRSSGNLGGYAGGRGNGVGGPSRDGGDKYTHRDEYTRRDKEKHVDIIKGETRINNPDRDKLVADEPIKDVYTPSTGYNPDAPILDPVADGSEHYTEYVVVAGDTAGTVAHRFFGDEAKSAEILKYNGLTSWEDVKIGQVIKIPGHFFGTLPGDVPGTIPPDTDVPLPPVTPPIPGDPPVDPPVPPVDPGLPANNVVEFGEPELIN